MPYRLTRPMLMAELEREFGDAAMAKAIDIAKSATQIGSLEVGKMADIVLWPTWSFGAKPRLIVKGGHVNWALMGDPNAKYDPALRLGPTSCR